MKALALVLVAFIGACSLRPPTQRPDLANEQSEMLTLCLPDSDTGRVGLDAPGCERPGRVRWQHTVQVYVIDAENALAVLEAIDVWNHELGFSMFALTLDFDAADVYVYSDGPNEYVRAWASFFVSKGKFMGVIGVHDMALGNVETMVHEMGHLLGLRHDKENRRSVMYPTSGRVFAKIEQVDLELLRAIYAVCISSDVGCPGTLAGPNEAAN